MRSIVAALCSSVSIAVLAGISPAAPPSDFIEIPADVLEDKLRGGMLAQIIGNINGLPHEFEYIDEPGNVDQYTPSLPKGARTDDDTDVEWVYLSEIVASGENFLPLDRMAVLWKRHINRNIYCANKYARGLMDLDLEPPWTGSVALNPWSDFNISGQFICESFGLMAPAMPQTAARLGLNYTHVAIDGEPAQTTQLFTTMIATAFVETELEKIIDAGAAAIDPKSDIVLVVAEVRRLHRANPDDWRATRRALKDRWQKQGGIMRERNGYELNTASTVAALLYGRGDFVETLRHAFNFGWDADNNAATAATIVGVIRGRRWMDEQGWDIKNVYRNTTRDDMPNDETLTGLEDKLIAAARITIQKNGGKIPSPAGKGLGEGALVYRINAEKPANVERLATPAELLAHAQSEFGPQLERDLSTPGVARSRAAYLAICLGKAEELKARNPAAWSAALADLQENYPNVVRNLFNPREPIGIELRQKAEAVGLNAPPKK